MKLLSRREGIKDLLLVRHASQLPTDDQKYISGLLINLKDLKKILYLLLNENNKFLTVFLYVIGKDSVN